MVAIPALLMPTLLSGGQPPQAFPVWFGLLYLGLMLSWLLLWPWSLTLIKRYQHRGYALGKDRADIDLPVGSIYGLVLKGIGMGVLVMIAGILLALLCGVAAAVSSSGTGQPPNPVIFAPLALIYLAMGLIVGGWGVARLQDLVWSGTHSQHLHFSSRLSARSYMGLCTKNWLLTLVTIGLYRPFAVVAGTRMRLEAAWIEIGGSIDDLQAEAEGVYQDATGDASGDFFGIDLGL
jgi:uncharacterized membrane protein YjgN (DUF898 family)